MDIRSLDNDVLLETDAYLREQAERISQERGVTIDLGEFTNAKPGIMDADLRAILQDQVEKLGIPAMNLSSGAGHDCATFANEGVPTAMIFIRNDKGSHNADETMEIEDFAEATRLLVAFLKELG
jgi:N-carbamoyl-L-amino-acid hydrolase